ncbi:MAG: hypothetical protein AAFW84_32410 [Cyanobacteria bacterium J06635_15]
MCKLVLFRAEDGSKRWSTLTRPDGSQIQVQTLEQHLDCSGKPAPEPGYRLSETKRDMDAATHYHMDSSYTHYRPGPWRVSRVESYVPDLPVGTEFAEIVVCTCEYTPLPEDTPWREYNVPVVTLDSFGGDEAAFEAFLTTDEAKKLGVLESAGQR